MGPMTQEVRAAALLAGEGVAATADLIRGTHLAIARRAFRLSGPGGRPAWLLHDAIARGVYASVCGAAKGAGLVGGVLAARKATAPALREHPRGQAVLGALNGAWGDLLHRRHDPLALPMTLRRDDRDLPLDRDRLAAALKDATDDVAVFVHGLCETDAFWRFKAQEHHGDPRSTHGSRLAAATGCTDVYVRYNTGRHISDNGADLARLLETLVDVWPVPVRRLTLVGHSMGGLVIRSACHHEGQRWHPLATRIVFLGAPHLGAPLERGARAAGAFLRRVPETRPVAEALATRSVGIKDLRFGDTREQDWRDVADLDAWRPEPAECAPLLDGAEHYYIGATLTQRHDHAVARVLGDALVPWHSASGDDRRRRLGLAVDRGRHLGGLHHFDLLNHPRVWAVLEQWLVAEA